MLTGKTKKIFSGLIKGSSDDVSLFKMGYQDKTFLIGDHRGYLSVFDY